MESILLELIDDNPFNSRIYYREQDLLALSSSLSQSGQLVPIRVRPKSGRFEIIYGHRRVKAARLLNWKTIEADIEQASDEQMVRLSLVENLDRKDISDYEKAMCFSKMKNDFNMTFDQIGKLVGYSKPYVSNLVRMTGLVEKVVMDNDPKVRESMLKISEHHARVLLEVEDQIKRTNLLVYTVHEGLSVRDLERIVHRLRSWFRPDARSEENKLSKISDHEALLFNRKLDIEEIKRVLWAAECDLPHEKNFGQFEKMHAFKEGFSLYDDTPPFIKLKDSAALRKKKDWFYTLAPKYYSSLRDVEIQIYGGLALSTMYVDYRKSSDAKSYVQMTTRGSVVLLREGETWKILHEHWSKLDDIPGNTSGSKVVLRNRATGKA